MEFNHRVAIVTGGASGMGAATVRRLAAGGANVMIVDRNGDLAQTVADGSGRHSDCRRRVRLVVLRWRGRCDDRSVMAVSTCW